jgi:cytochrome c
MTRLDSISTRARAARWIPAFAGMTVGIGGAIAADTAYGEYLASECITCHQLSGKTEGIPAIAGMPLEAFVAAFTAYKSKTRENVTMQTLASRYTEEDILALGTYFASIKPSED